MTEEQNDTPKPAPSVAPVQTLDMSNCGAELMTALAKAQGAVLTIGKDGHNRDKDYNYASADNVARTARAPLADNGIAALHVANARPCHHPLSGGKQWICAWVEIHFVLTHSSGESIRGVTRAPAIGRHATPNDKAQAAAKTYWWGFTLLGLLNMDRAEEGSNSVDARGENDNGQPSQGGQRRDARSVREEPTFRPKNKREDKPAAKTAEQLNWGAAMKQLNKADEVYRAALQENGHPVPSKLDVRAAVLCEMALDSWPSGNKSPAFLASAASALTRAAKTITPYVETGEDETLAPEPESTEQPPGFEDDPGDQPDHPEDRYDGKAGA